MYVTFDELGRSMESQVRKAIEEGGVQASVLGNTVRAYMGSDDSTSNDDHLSIRILMRSHHDDFTLNLALAFPTTFPTDWGDTAIQAPYEFACSTLDDRTCVPGGGAGWPDCPIACPQPDCMDYACGSVSDETFDATQYTEQACHYLPGAADEAGGAQRVIACGGIDPGEYYCDVAVWKQSHATLDATAFPGPLALTGVTVHGLSENLGWAQDVRAILEAQGFGSKECLQKKLLEQLTAALQTRLGGFQSTMADAIAETGGIQIAPQDRRIYFNIAAPGGQREAEARGCPPTWHPEYAKGVTAPVLSTLVDMPKVVAQGIDRYAGGSGLELHVTCNWGRDCEAEGAGDSDGDGWCDDEDYCPDMVTGINCDNDGDGFGDGDPRTFAQCLGFPITSPDRDRLTQAQRYAACGGCDTCQGLPNGGIDDYYTDATGLRHQFDRDGDGVGNECDLDKDGDGVANDMDCSPWNPQVGRDWDRDQICDDGCSPLMADITRDNTDCAPCIDGCWAGPEAGSWDIGACVRTCLKDNCIDEESAYCQGLDRCDPPGTGCDAEQHTACRTVFGNPDQEDSDGDGVGDQCEELTVGPVDVRPKGLVHAYCWELGGCIETRQHDTYEVSFRTWGGYWSESEDQTEAPRSIPTTRTDMRVGACTCPQVLPNGEWDSRCTTDLQCPKKGENRLDQYGRPLRVAWNPIDAPQMAQRIPSGGLMYPVDPQAEYALQIAEHKLVQHRTFPFRRDGANRQRLSWRWQDPRDSVLLPLPGDPNPTWPYIGDEYIDQSTQVRVAWFQAGQQKDYLHQTRYSAPYVMTSQDQKGWGVGPLLVEEFVISKIPGSLDRVGREGVSTPGYLLGRAGTGDLHLYELGPDSPQVSRVWDLDLPDSAPAGAVAGASGLVPASLVGGDEGPQQAMVLYAGAGDGPVRAEAGGPGGADLYLLTPGAQGRFSSQSLRRLLGIAVPLLSDVHLTFLGPGRLVLAGSSGGQTLAYRIDLADGSMAGPFVLDLDGISCWTPDPGNERLYVLSATQATASSSLLAALDPADMSVSPLPRSATRAGPAWRERCGMGFDPSSRTLYLAGGQAGSQALADVWRFDLGSGRWEELAAAGETGPGPLLDPLVRVASGRLWVGQALGRSTAQGLSAWSQSLGGGPWRTSRVFELATQPSWPLEGAFTGFGPAPGAITVTPEEIAWPGRVLLASLDQPSDRLGIQSYDQTGDLTGRSSAMDGHQALGLVCPPGSACLLTVQARQNLSEPIDFTLHLDEAELAVRDRMDLGARVSDLLLRGPLALVASHRGLTAVGLSDQGSLVRLGRTHRGELPGLRAMAPCGPYVCLARLRCFGLATVDVTHPEHMNVVAQAPTMGPAWDLAVSGRQAYLAHGIFGIGTYDITDPLHIQWTNETWPGGWTVTLAARGDLIAAGSAGGLVTIYRRDQGRLTEIAQVPVNHRIRRIRFHGRFLWIQGRRRRWLRIYDLSDPESPELKARLGAQQAHWADRVLLGPWALAPSGRSLELETFEVTP